MNRNLVGSTYGRFCIKFPRSRMKGERHRLSPLSLISEKETSIEIKLDQWKHLELYISIQYELCHCDLYFMLQ
jgi:hypothetical protein